MIVDKRGLDGREQVGQPVRGQAGGGGIGEKGGEIGGIDAEARGADLVAARGDDLPGRDTILCLGFILAFRAFSPAVLAV